MVSLVILVFLANPAQNVNQKVLRALQGLQETLGREE